MLVVGYVEGSSSVEDSYQQKCVAKYAEMPHNKVENFCKDLLKFDQSK